ncbi:MAG: tetratricopeptide repeat protein [Paludibacteraceae bacterium]|nr:tetratricopeptide repeat protein [Paludibacteraceae bacterium]
MENRTIKIFISSSCELSAERKALAEFATEVNNIWCDKGITVIPVEWEFVESGLNGGSKQDEYNQAIDECVRCVVMFATKVGKYTKKDLVYALRRAKEGGNPKRVNVLFKCDDFKELEKYPDVSGVYYYLMNNEAFPEKFNTLESLKLKFLTYIQYELKQCYADLDLKLEEGKVMMGGKEFLDLDNLPSVNNNEDYQYLLEQIADQKDLLSIAKDEETRLRRLTKLSELLEKKAKMEKNIWDVTLGLARMSNQNYSDKQKNAIRMMENGDFKEALALLSETDSGIIANHKKIEDGKETSSVLMSNINEYKIRIDVLKSMMENGWVEKVIELYGKILDAARGYVEGYELAELLFEYAKFLQEENQFHLAEQPYTEALEIRRELAATNPSAYLPDVAATLNNLGNLHSDNNRYEEAEEEYKEALGIYRELAKTNPSAYRPDVAGTLNNLGVLHWNNNKYEEAEKEYKEALEIRRELAKTNPSAYRPDVAMTLNNLGILHRNNNRYEEAEKEYKEALGIYRELAAANPSAYLPDVAMTLNNLGVLHQINNRYEEAEKEYKEALGIRRELAVTNPSAYRPNVAGTLNNLGILHSDNNRYEEAEEEYEEALGIYRELAAANTAAYRPYVATTLNNLGILHWNNNRYEEAEEEYKEALEIRRELAKEAPSVYKDGLAYSLCSLAIIHMQTNRFTEAESEYKEALALFRELDKSNLTKYHEVINLILDALATLYDKTNRKRLAKKTRSEASNILGLNQSANRKGLAKKTRSEASNIFGLNQSEKPFQKDDTEKYDLSKVLDTDLSNPKILSVFEIIDNISEIGSFAKKNPELETFLKQYFCTDNLDNVPSYWNDVQKYPDEKKLFALFALIFMNKKVLDKLSSSSNNKNGGNFDLKNDNKLGQNKVIGNALIESGASESFTLEPELSYDFSLALYNTEIGKLFCELLKDRLVRKDDRYRSVKNSDLYFFEFCKKNRFAEALGTTYDLFYHWLKGEPTNGSYIKSVDIADFLCVKENIHFDFGDSKEIYLLGKNGDGKTLLLMGIYLAFNENRIMTYDNGKVGIAQQIIKSKPKLRGYDEIGRPYERRYFTYLKNFYAYGTHRGRYGRMSEAEKYGFMSLFDINQTMINPLEWLKTIIFRQNISSVGNRDSGNHELKMIQGIFDEILDRHVEIMPDLNEDSGFIFEENGAKLSLDKLSEGYRSVIVFICDLLCRLYGNDFNEKVSIKDTKGVVIVDEIDAHLHPSWQRKIVGKLRKLFPNIQFIFSTHSPTIIQGATSEDAKIYCVYRKDGQTKVSDPYYKKNLDYMMMNTLVTSPLFGLDDARVNSEKGDADTSDSYLLTKIENKLRERIKEKNLGSFLTDEFIENMIEEAMKEEGLE